MKSTPRLRQQARSLFLAFLGSLALALSTQADQNIYTDSLQNGWQNWSWATVNFNNSTPIHSGTKSISVTAGAWQAVSFWHSAQSASPFTAFSFWIHGGTAGGQTLQVYAENAAGGSHSAVGIPAPVAGTWQHVTLSLSSLGVAGVADMTRFNIQNASGNSLATFYVDDVSLIADTTPPVLQSVSPPAGTVAALTSVVVTFSEPVTGVDAGDLLLNGNPALSMSGSRAAYTFTFAPPPEGTLAMTWYSAHGITDFGVPANPFNATGPGATWQYTLVDTIPPTVAQLFPGGGARIASLGQIEVTFSETVLGVDASDLLINGSPATNVTKLSGRPYVFQFSPPSTGLVSVAWAPGHAITDTAAARNAFAGGAWSYTLDPNLTTPDLVLNEILCANLNTNGLADEDGTLEDWIEIYNRGTQSADLSNWSLSDDPTLPGLWTFPTRTLAPGQFLVVFASGKDRQPVSGPLHTNFKLAVNGEQLGLYSPDSPRKLVSGFTPYPEQRNDVSYGLDLLGELRYFGTPTPGSPNGLSSIVGVVEPVHANVSRGHFNAPFTLVLSCPTPGATLRYTTNGSEPTASSPAFPGSLTVSGTTLLRAAGFKTNYLPSKTLTQSYLFNLPSALRTLPVVSLVTDSNNLWGPTGIMGVGANYTNALNHGVAWERPTSIEWIQPEDNSGFQVNCGVRVEGSDYTRNNASAQTKYSLRLYFRGDYGEGRLNYRLFPLTEVDQFDGLALRAGMNEQVNPFIRDELHRRLFHDMGAIASHGNMAIVLLNGNYYTNASQPWILPVYNPCERVTSEFYQTYLGGSGLWDVVKPPWQVGGGAVDGSFDNMQALVNFANSADVTQQSNYAAISAWLDLTNFADYVLLNTYAGMGDWPGNNWRAGRNQAGGMWRFTLWDSEWGMGIYGRSPTNINTFTLSSNGDPNASGLAGSSEISTLYQKLRTNPEFRLLWADRVQRHFYNGGALSGANITNRFRELANELSAIIPSMDQSILNWVWNRQPTYSNQMSAQGLLSTVAAPTFSQYGGRVPAGFTLTMTAPAGTIYYTTNGTDPRVAFTGAVSASATAYSAAVPINATRTFNARARQGTNWSALTVATFTYAALGSPLRITELMYNPVGGSIYEFIELQNTSGVAVDLGGVYFDGINFTFTAGTILGPGARAVLGSNTDTNSWKTRYTGVNPIGWFGGNLSNGGERISLFDKFGTLITSVDYSDGGGWPTAADGGGRSLEIVNVNGNPDEPANWQASAANNGTPGAANSAPPAQPVYLNEVMAENVSAVDNGGTFPDWIELRNPGASAVNLAGWSLTDDGNARKFVFPSTPIAAGGYLVVWCDATTNTTPGLHTGFSLNKDGETVSLYDPSTNRIDALTFGLQLTNLSVGRISGNWTLTTPTANAANVAATLAATTNLVLNEWLANSAPGLPDWVELYNKSTTLPVSLQGVYLATSNDLYQLTSLSFLPPLGYVQLLADKGVGPNHLDFKLSAAGDAIKLFDATGSPVQSVAFGAQTEGVSQGRFPDGTASIISFPGSVSPGAANYTNAYRGPVLNEVLARNHTVSVGGQIVDFIEIYNPAASGFNLGGMSLSVNSQQAGEWVFPTNTILAANAYLVIKCDGASPASTNAGGFNTGESLNGESGGVYLFNAANQLVNSVEYGPQVEDLSIGLSGGQWRLLASPTPGAVNASAAPLATNSVLRVNEWMASTAGADWFELFNPTNKPVDLSTVSLTDDPSIVGMTRFLPAPLSFIGAGGFVKWVADAGPGQGRNHVNFAINAAGDSLLVYGAHGTNFTLIDAVALGAQTRDVSEGRLPDGSGTVVPFPGSASPGESNYRLLQNVVVNELLAHTDPPLEDAIEFYNPTASTVDIGGWYLSNSRFDRRKYQIPAGTTIPAGGYAVIYEYQFNNGTTNAFTFNSAHGDEAWLSAATAGVETGDRAPALFGASFNGVSFGRVTTSVGVDFAPLLQRTFGVDSPATLAQFRTGTGLPNARPVVGPVVINEIMYHPVDTGTGVGEFVELCNGGSATVPLYDPAYPTNHWMLGGGVQYTFPAGVSLAPGASLLVVDFDPAANPTALANFRAYYGLSSGVPVYGPYSGALNNAGDTVELYRPDKPQQPPSPDAGFVPYVIADRVSYTDSAPWPTGAVDGGGLSLQRLGVALYGNEPLNWFAAAPTPGQSVSLNVDTDGDGIPDAAEIAMGLNPLDPSDAALDPDGDGMSNLQEYLAGTDHLNPNSNLRLEKIIVASNVTISFYGVSNRTYSVLYKNALTNSAWLKLTNVPAQSASQLMFVVDPQGGSQARFYRLVTPAILP